MSETHIICKNCDHQFIGNYCNNCGQKAVIHRINFSQLLHEFFHALTHLDKGIFYTSKMMLLAPGKTLRDYLYGKRKNHANPFLLLIIIGGICSYLYYHFDLKLLSSLKISDLDGGIHIIDAKFFAILYVLYSLLFSIFDFLLFRYKSFNFTELFTVNIFIFTEILLALILLVPVWLIGSPFGINKYLRLIIGLILIAYTLFVRYQFFQVKSDQKAIPRFILQCVLISFVFLSSIYKTIFDFFGI